MALPFSACAFTCAPPMTVMAESGGAVSVSVTGVVLRTGPPSATTRRTTSTPLDSRVSTARKASASPDTMPRGEGPVVMVTRNGPSTRSLSKLLRSTRRSAVGATAGSEARISDRAKRWSMTPSSRPRRRPATWD
ncbi:hypothetical protein P0F65_16325 [Sphingomonas sp. I4]